MGLSHHLIAFKNIHLLQDNLGEEGKGLKTNNKYKRPD